MSAPSVAPPRVLLIRRRYLGDIVLLNTLIRNLRQHWPAAQLVLLCDAAYAGAAALHGDLNAVQYFPRRVTQWPGFVAGLRREQFSHVLDFDNRDKTALFTRITGAAERLVLERDHPRFPLRHRWVYTRTVPMSREWHDSHPITDIYHALAAPLGVPATVTTARFRLRQDDVTAMQRLVGVHQRSKLLIHPGSRSRYRLWPAERFAALCDRLLDDLGTQVFLVGGPAERAIIEQIRQKAQTHLVVIDQSLSVPQLAALFAQFSVLLAHDSGPMHVAAGVGTRVVALYGAQNATIWRPAGKGHTVLQTTLPCPCLPADQRPGACDRNDPYFSYCVRQLDLETVYAAVAEQLQRASTEE